MGTTSDHYMSLASSTGPVQSLMDEGRKDAMDLTLTEVELLSLGSRRTQESWHTPATARAHAHTCTASVSRSCWERTPRLLLPGLQQPAPRPGGGSQHSSHQSVTQLCGPTQPCCPWESGSGPSGHPGTRRLTVPSVGQKLSSSNSHSLRRSCTTPSLHHLEPAGKHSPLPQVKAQEPSQPGPGPWEARLRVEVYQG